MFIETPRLIIRNFEPSDLEALYSILSDPDVMRFSRSGICTKEGAEKFLNDMIEAYPHHSILACRDYGFTQLNLKKLVARIEPQNMASIRVVEHWIETTRKAAI